ncbi:metal-dependent hydrolase [Arsukibacterium sp.]|uniref:metal-dependent hydrolase n=1 Tax=Arsukibacterium sp. TaxID=1977258 RepID=UPI002FD89C27
MDSLTQIALGSAVAIAVVGKHSTVRKAALWGAVAGTLPDLDVFVDYGDALSNMVYHRGETHALFYLSLFSPFLAALICRIHGEFKLFKHWWLAVSLVLITHPLLDTMTVYGTQLLLPFSNYPFGIASIFIIDPLYTLPLLIGIGWACFKPRQWLAASWCGLGLSSAYLMWTVVAQHHVTQLANQQLTGVPHQQVLVQPTPLNTILWRVVVMTPDGYLEGFYSFTDNSQKVEFNTVALDHSLLLKYRQHPEVQTLARFSHGFFSLVKQDQQLILSDLRMGLQGNYAFSFVIDPDMQIPASAVPADYQFADTLSWVWQRLTNNPVTEPVRH